MAEAAAAWREAPLDVRGSVPLRHRLWRVRYGLIGAFAVLVILAGSFLAPWVAPHDPYRGIVSQRLIPPAWEAKGSTLHLLGTDQVGRDYLSRLIFGSRISLAAGFLSTLFAALIGIPLGVTAGYFGGRWDNFVSFAVNVMLAFPGVLLALAVISVLGPSFFNLIVVLGITSWPLYTRVVRAEVMSYREQEFTLAARGIGGTQGRIILRHIFPNLISTILVVSTLEVAHNILREAFLSFLGLGVQPPIPSWGGMLSEGRTYMLNLWWLAAFPGIAIFATTLGINLLGDALRDFLDPHQAA
ncbi:MAG: ABC transporter permease [Candidatus Tectomicrobia bacterium]|uniref:ABC transporter permease n=1 Tax=Tectimicrobiota bacterium TaxID=2528274 RepID=A0A932HWQ0_UNCTE|nr:ABC transporter permease [Candidatus Tectomicrobia bacterium]